ncbi:hypothetical protein KC19_VG340800 [Ceratodon purpureus]|uniref:Uncharacterized protein n=1 Tax=Ceratodon purpureus TaxID=3225 RepID=A0A8T0HXH1_CERPU|nr:hypothetical protein KC19_VG340800 [Ceratodon purpureus]
MYIIYFENYSSWLAPGVASFEVSHTFHKFERIIENAWQLSETISFSSLKLHRTLQPYIRSEGKLCSTSTRRERRSRFQTTHATCLPVTAKIQAITLTHSKRKYTQLVHSATISKVSDDATALEQIWSHDS